MAVRRAVGISWPASDRKLAAPMPRTPVVNQSSCGLAVASVMATVWFGEATRVPCRCWILYEVGIAATYSCDYPLPRARTAAKQAAHFSTKQAAS